MLESNPARLRSRTRCGYGGYARKLAARFACSAAAALLFAPALAAASPSPAFRTAIVIGVNEPFEASQPTLQYADDDAARYYELLAPEVDQIELLAVLDPASQPLYPDAAARARPPDRAELAAALARAKAGADSARASGRRTELWFIYTGHGRLHGGEGEVKLRGGSLRRTELTETVLAPRTHDRTHLIVDACNAYHLVNARGAADDAAQLPVTTALDGAFDRFLESQTLSAFPTVGVVLSTSGAGVTHEWSRYQGGVFSHEIRSALLGAADASGDGRVDYTEIEAFLTAANLAVPELKGRPRVYVRAPAIEQSAAVLEPRSRLAVLSLPSDLEAHVILEDDRGLRTAELNKAAGYAVALRLPARPAYVLALPDGAELLRIDRPELSARIELPLPIAPRAAAAALKTERGGDEPPGAFAEPFGPRFLDGFRAARDARPFAMAPSGAGATPAPLIAAAESSTFPLILGLAAGGLAIAATGGAVWSSGEARASFRVYDTTPDRAERDAARLDVERSRALTIGFGTAAAVSAVTSAALLLLFDR